MLICVLPLLVLICNVPSMQEVYLVGGHIRDENDSKGNVFTVPSNRYTERNCMVLEDFIIR